MPDPKLKEAMKEIRAVLNKYDIVASVLLASPTHVEFLREFKASWSCCWITEDGMLHVRCKGSDFPTVAAHKKALEDTIGVLAGFADTTLRESEALSQVLQHLKVNFEHRTTQE